MSVVHVPSSPVVPVMATSPVRALVSLTVASFTCGPSPSSTPSVYTSTTSTVSVACSVPTTVISTGTTCLFPFAGINETYDLYLPSVIMSDWCVSCSDTVNVPFLSIEGTVVAEATDNHEVSDGHITSISPDTSVPTLVTSISTVRRVPRIRVVLTDSLSGDSLHFAA